MTTTVTWKQDENSKYVIESANHLRQITSEGNLYTDAGSPPASYWSSAYVFSADIDLLGDTTGILPIRPNTERFTATFDMAGYKILNIEVVDTDLGAQFPSLFSHLESLG